MMIIENNFRFLNSKSVLEVEKIYEHLCEINQRRFKGKLLISYHGGSKTWFIGYQSPTRLGSPGFQIRIKSSKRDPDFLNKLEFRHTYGKWMLYVLSVFTEELSSKLNAIISDESISKKWKGKPNDYPSFKTWIRDFYPLNCNSISIDQFIDSDLKDAPEELRDC